MRNLATVIDELLGVLPSSIKDSVTFASPEMTDYWWKHTESLVNKNMSNSYYVETWQHEAVRIWNKEE